MTIKGKQSSCLGQETVGNRQLALAEPQTLSTDFFLDKAISNRLSQQQALSATGPGLHGTNGIRQEAVALLCACNSLSILMTNNFKYVLQVALFGSFYINIALFLREEM